MSGKHRVFFFIFPCIINLSTSCFKTRSPEASSSTPVATPAAAQALDRAQFETRRADLLGQALKARLAHASSPGNLMIRFPIEGSVFPPEITNQAFYWDDSSKASVWLIELTLSDGQEPARVLSRGDRDDGMPDAEYLFGGRAHTWKPDDSLWKRTVASSVEKSASLAIFGFSVDNPNQFLSQATVHFQVSRDPVGAPIIYRHMPLEFGLSAIARTTLRSRDVSQPQARVLLSRPKTCMSCHSFSADASKFGIDLDSLTGDKGGYLVTKVSKTTAVKSDDIMTWNSYEKQPRETPTLGLFSRLSPDGRYALSTVKDLTYNRRFTSEDFVQAFYPVRGILAVYDTRTKKISPLAGADDEKFVQTNGVWSPDGKTIVFCRATARDIPQGAPEPQYSGDPAELQIQYDLYKIPFNDGRGGKAEPLIGASSNGKSNSFPKFTPDGKWIIFVEAQNGYLMRRDSKLFIVPAVGGPARELQSNLALMNSWHSISPNGRWMVFSSKGFGLYTQFMLTHLDADGNATPPVLIPNTTAAHFAANIPEFANLKPDALQGITLLQEYVAPQEWLPK